MVNRQQVPGLRVTRHLVRLLGRGVGGDVRVVRADAEDRQVDRADAAEQRRVRRVAGEQDTSTIAIDQVCVESAMAVEERACAPVVHLTRGDLQRADGHGFGPMQFGDVAKAEVPHQVGRAARTDDRDGLGQSR